MTSEYTMPLREAVERFRRKTGSTGNAYEWYRKQAHRSGRVWMGNQRQFVKQGDCYLTVVKVGRIWMVSSAELEARINEHRSAQTERQQITEDFARQILHGEPGSNVRTSFGSYTVYGDFHAAFYDSVDRYSGNYAHWACSRCWQPASTEHNKPECHSCSDWGGCGRDCTLSRVFCDQCGTSLPR